MRSDQSDEGTSVRYYGLDALRAVAMALGIVLHAALPYFNTYEKWPSDDGESLAIWVVFEFIHIWRMPLFFILGGFLFPMKFKTSGPLTNPSASPFFIKSIDFFNSI